MEDKIEFLTTPDTDPWLLYCRFICATILHLSLIDNVYLGMSMMRYAVNHTSKFETWAQAWLVGFMNFTAVVSVELTNMLLIITGISFLDITF